MPGTFNLVEVARAAKQGNLRVLHQFIHSRRADGSDDILDRATRCTALHHAAEANNASSVLMLIRAGIHIDARNAEGKTAMHLAAANSSYSAIRVLVRNRASLDVLDQNGLTPLDIALRCGDPEGTTNAILEAARGQGVGRSTDREPSVDEYGMPLPQGGSSSRNYDDDRDNYGGSSSSPLGGARSRSSGSPLQQGSAPAGHHDVSPPPTSASRRVFGANLPVSSSSPSSPQVVVRSLRPPQEQQTAAPRWNTQLTEQQHPHHPNQRIEELVADLATSSVGSSVSNSSADSKTTTLLGTVNTGIPKPTDDCLIEALQCPIDFGFYNLLNKKPCVLVCCGKSVCHQCLIQVKRCPFCNTPFPSSGGGASRNTMRSSVVFNRSLMDLLRK